MTRAAKAAGITRAHLSNYLSGSDNLSLKTAHLLARHLQRIGIEVSLTDLAEEQLGEEAGC